MVYEIVNPSDMYTMKSDDQTAASVACLVLGSGKYGLIDSEGNNVCPMFMFGDVENKVEDHFGTDFKSLLEKYNDQIADILDSVEIGSFADREDVESARTQMAPDAFRDWNEKRTDRKRSSMNNIGKRAKEYANAFRARSQKGQNNA